MNVNPDELSDLIVNAIADAVDGPRVQGRLAELEARVAALEQRPRLQYAGVFQPGEVYSEGRLTTHAGGLWLSIEETRNVPGTANSGWLLVVKRGDAR